jgi:peptide/nickel transport system substrate-binding protein
MRRGQVRKLVALPLLAGLILAACAPGTPKTQSGEGTGQASGAVPQSTLAIVLRVEPVGMTDSASSLNRISLALFSAYLAQKDNKELPYPVLAEAVPQLNTDTWRILPDGKMETTFRLRSGLTWHDGHPLTAEDFAFGRRVAMAKIEWGLLQPSPELALVEDLTVADPTTLTIRWKQPYPDAQIPDLLPAPQHVLQAALDQGTAESFGSLPYWTTEYLGAGPYRLEQWAQGAYIEGGAFDGFALGRPRIDRVRMTWSNDPNVSVVRLLSGDAHIALDSALQFQQAATLRREWGQTNAGSILLSPTQLRYLQVQHRPQFTSPPALLDLRVRKAILHAIDRRALADALLEGEGIVADSYVPPTVGYYDAVDRAITKYPFDPRRTEQTLTEAGMVRGSDGLFVGPGDARFSPEVRGLAEGQEAQETTILADFMRRAGIDANLNLVPASQRASSDEFKATFPGMTTNYNTLNRDYGMAKNMTARLATPENRWSGSNKIGWSNPEYDRLYDTWNTTLDRAERNDRFVQMLQLVSEELPAFPLYFNFEVVAHVASLQGPPLAAPEGARYGNIHEWQWR